MFSKLFPFILVALLVTPAMAQYKADTNQYRPSWLNRRSLTKDSLRESPLIIRNKLGQQYKAQRGEKMSPMMVVDSISFFDGLAIFALNTQRGRGKSRLVARSENDIHILSIYKADVDSTVISRTLDTIKVYSAAAADDSWAEITLMIQ